MEECERVVFNEKRHTETMKTFIESTPTSELLIICAN